MLPAYAKSRYRPRPILLSAYDNSAIAYAYLAMCGRRVSGTDLAYGASGTGIADLEELRPLAELEQVQFYPKSQAFPVQIYPKTQAFRCNLDRECGCLSPLRAARCIDVGYSDMRTICVQCCGSAALT